MKNRFLYVYKTGWKTILTFEAFPFYTALVNSSFLTLLIVSPMGTRTLYIRRTKTHILDFGIGTARRVCKGKTRRRWKRLRLGVTRLCPPRGTAGRRPGKAGWGRTWKWMVAPWFALRETSKGGIDSIINHSESLEERKQCWCTTY